LNDVSRNLNTTYVYSIASVDVYGTLTFIKAVHFTDLQAGIR
jgi:hypothetical protein